MKYNSNLKKSFEPNSMMLDLNRPSKLSGNGVNCPPKQGFKGDSSNLL
jgi:hypothetical protein